MVELNLMIDTSVCSLASSRLQNCSHQKKSMLWCTNAAESSEIPTKPQNPNTKNSKTTSNLCRRKKRDLKSQRLPAATGSLPNARQAPGSTRTDAKSTPFLNKNGENSNLGEGGWTGCPSDENVLRRMGAADPGFGFSTLRILPLQLGRIGICTCPDFALLFVCSSLPLSALGYRDLENTRLTTRADSDCQRTTASSAKHHDEQPSSPIIVYS